MLLIAAYIGVMFRSRDLDKIHREYRVIIGTEIRIHLTDMLVAMTIVYLPLSIAILISVNLILLRTLLCNCYYCISFLCVGHGIVLTISNFRAFQPSDGKAP